jgi:hypothetical protein
VWRGRPAREISGSTSFLYYAKINRANIVYARHELTPRRQRIADAPQLQRSCEIISTAAGHDQNRKSETYELREMAVNRSVAAENNYDIRIIRRRRRTRSPLRASNVPKPLHASRDISRTKNGGSAHE